MSDPDLRELERRAKASDQDQDHVAWLRERIRQGEISENEIMACAHLGYVPARRCLRLRGLDPGTHAPSDQIFMAMAILHDAQPWLRAGLTLVRWTGQDQAIGVVTEVEFWIEDQSQVDLGIAHRIANAPAPLGPVGHTIAVLLARFAVSVFSTSPDDLDATWDLFQTLVSAIMYTYVDLVPSTRAMRVAVRRDLVPYILHQGDPARERAEALIKHATTGDPHA